MPNDNPRGGSAEHRRPGARESPVSGRNTTARRDVRRAVLSRYQCSLTEPAVGIEPTTARLRIGCSTTELCWRTVEVTVGHALARTRTATPFGTTPSRWRVYQFHHQGRNYREPGTGNGEPACYRFSVPTSLFLSLPTGLTGLEPATSGVTDRHSNQAELQPQTTTCERHLPNDVTRTPASRPSITSPTRWRLTCTPT